MGRSGRRRGYKTAFNTQHVLWTDGGELWIDAFTLLLYFSLQRKMSSHVGQDAEIPSHIFTQGAIINIIYVSGHIEGFTECLCT